jgi:hypothetical protein
MKDASAKQLLDRAVAAEQATMAPVFAQAERDEILAQVADVTNLAVEAVHDVVRTAERLERLIIENASRVQNEIDGHVVLAGKVKDEAARLGEMITAMRDHQEALANAHRPGH